MTLPAGRPNAVALLLAAGTIAVLIGVVFLFAPGVGAHDCADFGTTPDVHMDTDGDACGATSSGHRSATTHAALSSTEPGAVNVAIRLTATAEAAINPSNKITVDFSGFNLPSSISNPSSPTATTSKVTITAGATDFFPTEIRVQGTEVILTVPTGLTVNSNETYTITFKTTARIRNPYYEGNWPIIVSSDVTGDTADNLVAVIPRTTTITPSKGARGTSFTLTGKGYPIGTVTIFDGSDKDVDTREILDAKPTNNGAVTFSNLRVRDTYVVNDEYMVWTKDSKGVVNSAAFTITAHTVSFEPPAAVAGSRVTINIADWQLGSARVAAVHIAGQQAYGTTEYQDPNTPTTHCYDNTGLKSANSNNVVSFEVNVPDGTLPGMQAVEVYTDDQLEHNSCTADTSGWTKQPNATLKNNPTPIIRKTIEIVSELPPVEPLGLNIEEVDGGLDQELKFKVDPPASNRNSYLNAGDQIEISLPGFDLSEAVFNSQAARERVKIYGSNALISEAVSPTNVDPSGGKIILTLPVIELGAQEHLNITIKKETGILTPEIPRGFDTVADGYPVTFTFVDKAGSQPRPRIEVPDQNVVVVKNPISSSVPSATVRVDLFTYAEAEIGPGQEITVDFSGPSADSEFVVPASISASRITIDPESRASFSPSDVLVQGARVILTIPTGTTTRRSVPMGEYEIRFSQLARIRNPFAAGNQVITVSSTVPGDEPDEITAVIRRTTTIEPTGGPRGATFELEGKGYARGTVTIYHDANDNERIDAGETLASVNTVRGAFDVDLVARGMPGDPVYRVRTRDSEGAGDVVEFRIRSGMLFEPVAARVGWPLRITISDWQDDRPEVAAVSIAGEEAYVVEVIEYENCFDYDGVLEANSAGVVSFEVDVPRLVPGGQQTVAVYDHKQLEHYQLIDEVIEVFPDSGACVDLDTGQTWGSRVYRDVKVKARLKSEPIAIIKETIDIDTAELTLSPSSSARGQKVTITGSGFTRAARGSDHIDSVWIGGKRVVDDHSGFEVGSNGDIAFAVTVPLNIANGPNEVRIEGTDHTLGQATLTVPEATISLDPPMGQRGTDFTIAGTGFIANSLVFVTYGAGVGAPPGEAKFSGLLADSQGRFELLFQVPITAEVGKRHLVTAVAQEEISRDTVTVEAQASHLIPRGNITTTPDAVSPGDRLTIRGQYLPTFTLVGPISIAGIELSLGSQVATDEDGNFETEVLIPHIDFSDHTLLVQVAGVIIPHIVTLAPPPLSGPPDQVFKYLIRDGVLSAVWSYDNATQSWSVFDPSLSGDMAALNDLTVVDRGDIVWVNLIRPQEFQGAELLAGWNLIALK